MQFRSLFHLLYRPSYAKLPLFPIYVTDRSYISRVLHYRYFRPFTDASGGSIYHRKYLPCRYDRNCLRGCSMGERVSYIDTNERRIHRELDSCSNYTWYLNNADSLLRKGNRPRPRESRPDIRVSDNCACVLASTRKKSSQHSRMTCTYTKLCAGVRSGPILTIYSHVVTTHYVRTRFRDCFESASRRRNVQRPSRKNVFTRP